MLHVASGWCAQIQQSMSSDQQAPPDIGAVLVSSKECRTILPVAPALMLQMSLLCARTRQQPVGVYQQQEETDAEREQFLGAS
jgi:hypothetical protein